MNYLVQWQHLSGESGHEYKPVRYGRNGADELAKRHAHRWGGIAVVMRISDGITVYRIVNIKEEHATAA